MTENAVLSPTGALTLVATGRSVFGLDTETGDVVNKIPLEIPFNFIALIGGTSRMLVVGTKVIITDAPFRPLIRDVTVGKNQSAIADANFLQGARVTIDGADAGPVLPDPADPGHTIIIDRGKKDLPKGASYSVVLTNRDGSVSEPFTLTRE